MLDEAQNIKNPETKQGEGRTVAGSRLPHRPDRNAGRKQRGRPVVDHGVFEPRLPGLPERVQAQLLRAHSGRAGPERGGARLKRVTGPFILRRLKTDRSVISDLPEKLEMKVFCSLTKEQASLYAAVLKETEETLESAEGNPAEGADPGYAFEAQAGMQPPGAVSRRQLRHC